jgi:hypothetical protein
MTTTNLLTEASDITLDDYCVFGVATCFVREDGEISQVKVLEPIPSAALEAIVKGIPTSYELACAKTLREIFVGEAAAIQIPAKLGEGIQLCDRFTERAIAATRTYNSRSQAKELIPLGTVKEDLNFSIDRKRVLNALNVVSTEDNVKQHEYTHKVL